MIKDKIADAVQASLDNMKKGDDYIPLNMRGELEVIVKDREGNIVSYERGHNQVTKLAKMAIIHLLAGEIGVVDSDVFSIEHSGESSDFQRVYSLNDVVNSAKIFPRYERSNHTNSSNLDGTLVSGSQFFYDGDEYDNGITYRLTQVAPYDASDHTLKLNFNFPTKMLFGTGVEAYDSDSLNNAYLTDFGQAISTSAAMRLNGYTLNPGEISAKFFAGCSSDGGDLDGVSTQKKLSNWYSNGVYRCRTLQPASSQQMFTTPINTDTSIKGAIKNCYITSTEDTDKYNATTKMAVNDYRGYGYPCFIYAKRSTGSFYNASEGNQEVYYQMNSALGSTPYETEITYTVNMPAQPVNSSSISSFYPYNGWILKQAGLFSDSRFKLRSEDNKEESSVYKEEYFLSQIAGNESDNAKIYRDSVGGQMLFTRNLSSPIMKTADTEVVFVWHIFITV